MELTPGIIIAERFEIVRAVTSGGMGTVFNARDRLTGQPVAIKVVQPKLSDEQKRLDQEAQVLAGLSHPAIVRYVAHGTTQGGHVYLVTEWLEGQVLASRIDSGGALSLADATRLARRVAEALSVAHARGIVHRDINPNNIFLVNGNVAEAKVLDFGIARLLHTKRALTKKGLTVGTPGYIAPEQLRGTRNLDARSDVFSLGCVFFECLTGRPAYTADSFLALVAKMAMQDAPRVRDLCDNVPEALDELVARMQARVPAQRPSDGADVMWQLDALGPLGNTSLPRRVTPIVVTPAEQRLVSLVIAAVSGDRNRAAETQILRTELASEWRMQALGATSEQFGASLELLADGSVVAMLIGTEAPTDLALRAARCALSMRKVLPNLPMVVATGRAVTEGTMSIEPLIEHAMRHLAPSETGAVSIDGATVDLLDARAVLRVENGRTFLVGEIDTNDATRKLLGKPTTCVGRERELQMLEATFSECVRESVARAILVTGPPGMGKSRLCRELFQRIGESEENVSVLFARGESVSAGAAFSVLGPGVLRAAGILRDEPLEDKRQKLKKHVARSVPADLLPWVTAFIGELCGVAFPDEDSLQLRTARKDPTLMGERMLAAWETWLSCEAKSRPMIIVIEDLHWGDLPSVNFIDNALKRIKDAPLFVLAFARPDVLEQFPHIWASRDLTLLRLGGLPRKACERLVREALGSQADTEQMNRLIDRADGNPFYLEELIRAFAAGVDSVPDTVLGTVQARLVTLDAPARRLLRIASVFGDVFSLAGVEALWGSEDDVHEWIDELVARELIVERSRKLVVTGREFVFRHALLREAAYGMLTTDDLRVAHRMAGEWLEARGQADPLELAAHLDNGGLPERALEYYQRVAETAFEGGDLRQTIDAAQHAIACGAEGDSLGHLLLLSARAHRWQGEMAAAHLHGVAATKQLTRGTAAWFGAVEEVIIAAARLDRERNAVEAAVQASAVEARGEDLMAQLTCLCVACGQLPVRAETARALTARVDALAGDLTKLDPRTAGQVHRLHASRARHAGDLARALAAYEAASASFDAAGDQLNACDARVSICSIHLEIGQYGLAERALREELSKADRIGSPVMIHRVLQAFGMVMLSRDDYETARSMVESTIEDTTLRDPKHEGQAHIYLSIIAYRRRDFARAQEEARAALALGGLSPSLRAAGHSLLARALIALQRPSEAVKEAALAMAILDRFGELEEFDSLVRLIQSEALAAAGADELAKLAAVEASERLQARAERLGSADWRSSFLSAVPENARTLELARD